MLGGPVDEDVWTLALRSAIVCNASGVAPGAEERAMGGEPECTNRLDWDCYGIDCQLPAGHEGDHEQRGDDGNSEYAEGAKFRPTSFVFRWRETDG